MNQETAKWVSRKRIAVEGFYLRCGHNFSADWAIRTITDAIMEWGDSVGFKRIRCKAIWDCLIEDWKQNQIDV